MTKKEFNFEDEKVRIGARKLLILVAQLFDDANINYSLEGGTLLGIVRDGQLLPWDHDLDISVNQTETEKILRLKWKLLKVGLKLSIRRNQAKDNLIPYGSVYLIKIKPLKKIIINALKGHKTPHFVVCDVFIKFPDANYYYWQAKDNIMRIERKYHDSTQIIPYHNTSLKVPNCYIDYLTEKYGDWSTPVKEWDCGKDEKTIWRAANQH